MNCFQMFSLAKIQIEFCHFSSEASKVIMQYVAEVSGKGKDIDRVKEQLLQSNPVLEGNVTLQKNNRAQLFKTNDIIR